MKITDLLSKNTICLNGKASDKKQAINEAAELIYSSGVINDLDTFVDGVFKREELSTTGVDNGVAIPHCQSEVVSKPTLAAVVYKNGIDFNSLDGKPTQLLFMIAAPKSNDNTYLDVLASLATLLLDLNFKDKLINCKNKDEFLDIINQAEINKLSQEKANDDSYPQILAATSCPTGIAHTYMAQEALEKAAKENNVTIKVETNGAGGVKNKLTQQEIEHAQSIIVSADAYIEMSRFNGKRLVESSVSKAISDADGLIKKALDSNLPIYHSNVSNKQTNEESGSKFHVFYRHLMSGISHMIPFVVSGGIILALSYLIDALLGVPKTAIDFGTHSEIAKVFHTLGGDIGLGLMLPVLGGFIAYSIAGKPGLASGFIGAYSATKGQFSLLYVIGKATNLNSEMIKAMENSAAGFLGAIVAGFIAGYVVLFLQKKFANLPDTFEGTKDILLIPLISSFVVGMSMFVLNAPFSYINYFVAKELLLISEAGYLFLLGALTSGLMATDMGGPINKASHYFATGLIISTSALSPLDPERVQAMQVMAANMVGIITPPVGIALATWIFPKKFTKEDRYPSVANFITGLCGITEGAIPYVTKDPVRVLVSCISGAAIGGACSILLGAKAIAPEGGVISMLVMGADGILAILAMIIGSIITAILLGILKKDIK